MCFSSDQNTDGSHEKISFICDVTLTIQISISTIQIVARAHKTLASGCHGTGASKLCHVIRNLAKFT